MSNWLQILLGSIPVVLILALLILKKKKLRIQWIASLAVIAVACVGAAFFAESDIFDPGASAVVSDDDDSSKKRPDARPQEYLDTAYSFMNSGALEKAERVLSDFLKKNSYSDEYVLAQARLNVMKDDFSAAAGLYGLVRKNSSEPDKNSLGKTEAELMTAAADSSFAGAACDDVSNEVKEIVAQIDENNNEELKGAVDATIYIDENSGEWEGLSSEEKAEIAKDLGKDIKKLGETASGKRYLSVEVLQDTKAKLDIMNGDYSEAVREMDNNMTTDGLIMTAELVRRGAVSSSDIKKLDIYKKNKGDSKAVENWLKEQLEASSFSKEEQSVINDILEELSDGYDDSADASELIESLIINYSENNSDSEVSKLYLELSRVKFSEGKVEEASVYLNTALAYATNSKDTEYSGAARRLIEIIRDPDNTEARKNIGKYTATMIECLSSDAAESIMPEERQGGSAGDNNNDSENSSGHDNESSEESRPSGGFNGDGNRPNVPDDEDQKPDIPFDQYFTDTLNQNSGSVDILSVDTSKFDTVEAIIAADESLASNAEEFKNKFDLLDCDIILPDYNVEKLEYSEVNLMLVCDNSGSMSGQKINDLKSALSSFASSAGDMNLAIVPFDDSVITGNVVYFGSSSAKIEECIKNMGAFGGTNIYSAVSYALEQMPVDYDALNVLVLMSDGQDYAPYQDEIEALKELCGRRNTSIYSMGLGYDVDSNVMNIYSNLGGGTYMYISDSNSLLSFYEYIYKLCMNRYRVTFTAPDNTKVRRSLRIEAKDSASVSDTYKYSLYESDITEDDLYEEYTVTVGDIVISGLENKIFYHSTAPQTTHLLGSGFTDSSSVSVEISGAIKYSLDAEFEDAGNIRLTIPADAACGIYDVFITVDSKRYTFSSGLVITSNDRHVIRFGDYVFTATELSEVENEKILGGVIDMNGWLGFTDTLTIRGDTENDYTVSLSYKKAYVQYTDRENTKGLAKFFASKGYSIPFDGVDGLVIYNDPSVSSTSDEYPTKAYSYGSISSFSIEDLAILKSPGLRLYPDRLVLNFEEFSMDVPYADKIAKAVAGEDGIFSFELDHSESIIFKNDEVGCDIEFEYKNGGDDYTPGKLGNMNINFRKAGLKIDLNTIEGSATLEVGVDIAFLSEGLSAKIVVKDWKIDELEVGADYKINTYIGNVPVTFDDFKLGLSGMADSYEYTDAPAKIMLNIIGSTWTGSFDCSMMNISSVFPGIEKFIDDAAVAKLDDTTVQFCLRDCYFSVATKLNLLGLIDIANCKLEFGANIPYTNLFLGMDDEKVGGLVAELNVGPQIDMKHFDLTFTGGLKVALTTGIIGVTVKGDIKVAVSWWIFEKDFNAHGEAFIGAYKTHSGNWQFAVYAAGTDGGKSMKPVCWPSGVINTVSI